jgi:2-polyprenyl-6-methoxyphenol hydroxylase-like FAD-dependent oxidoreductase
MSHDAHANRLGRRAVVIGASVTGLVAARVLSERFEEVMVFDRDRLSDAPGPRAGVPQGRHGHGLLTSGFSTLQTLFPTLGADLQAAGAVAGDLIGGARWHQHGYTKARFESELHSVFSSRPLLEGILRDQVRRLPNVTIFDNCVTLGLKLDNGRTRVTGVRVRSSRGPDRICASELVIDASGRASRSPEWLTEIGFDAPKMDTVHVGIGYTTRTYRRRPSDLNGDLAALIAPVPPRQTRMGFILPMENDRWIVSLGGLLGNYAPTDAAGFLEFARTLPRPDIYDVIKSAEPLTEAVSFGFPANVRRRYERLTRFPQRYLVMGDALCSFNPIYGQGMSVAALEGMALADALNSAHALEDLSHRFFPKAAAIVATPWTIAAGSDFAFPGVTGTKPIGTGLVNRYLGLVHKVASWDRVVCRAFFDVGNLRKRPTSLFRPSILARVVAGAWAGRAMRPWGDPPTAEAGTSTETLPLHNRAVMSPTMPGTTVTRSNVRRAS